MEMLKKFKKRIVPLVLAVVIFVTSVVSGPMSLTAQAASFSVTADTTVEFVMMLYNIFETISIASGIKDGLDDYDSGMSLFEAFISFSDSLTYDPFKEFTIYGPDGTALTRDDFNALWASAVSQGKLKYRPTAEEFSKYHVIVFYNDPGSSPEPSPEATAVPSSAPDVDPSTPSNPGVSRNFEHLRRFVTGGVLVKGVSDFLTQVQNNAVPEVDPAEYYGTAGLFDNELDQDADGNYLISGYVINGDISTGSYVKYLFDSNYSVPVAAYYSQGNGVNTYDFFAFLTYLGDNRFSDYRLSYKIQYYSNGALNTTKSSSGYSFSSSSKDVRLIYSCNIPIFDSVESAKEFLLSGSIAGLLNGVPYDYHSMTAAAPDTLENLSGTKLDPAKVPAMNNAMKEAANGVQATGTDKEANNAEMIAAVKAAVAEALAEAQPDPAPEPTAAPDPEPSTAPDPGTDTDYTGILGLILAAIKAIASGVWDFFSNPMGIITNGITSILELFPQVNTLIQALPAAVFGFFQDPLGAITSGISNLYNGVLRIIEIFPEQVQLVLGNIASLPDALLQVFADPLGAIQSLLGLLPSWANLQAYLDKILQALLDPVSVVLPSDPGGTDPGGDGSDGGGSRFNLSSLFNGLIYLILILILLLKIFIHCLQFIINIFKIEPTQGFLPDDMVSGLNFLKQLQIEGIGLSVYDFMMGLVYILMFFGVVKLLRGYVYKIHIPSGGK